MAINWAARKAAAAKANAGVHLTIKGLPEVSAALKRMDKPAAIRLVRKAFRKALKPVLARVKEFAPKETGALADAAKILAGRTDRGLIRQRIVISRRAASSGKKVFHGSLIERGHRQGPMYLGRLRKKIKGYYFMKRALDLEGKSAALRGEEYLWDEVQKVFGAKPE